MKFKIAVVQFEIKQFLPKENLKKAEVFINKASSAGAHVIIFPEDFVDGPILRKKEFVDFKGKLKKHFRDLAKKYSIDIITGSFIEGSKRGWFNTSYYIDSKGEIKAKYQKINLWVYERNYLSSGNKVVTFNTKFGKAGLIICWDLFSPEIFRAMIKNGVRIVYCPSYWTKKDARNGFKYNPNTVGDGIDFLCSARAFENEIIVVYVNGAGKFKLGKKISDDLVGHSQVSVPFIGPLKKLNHNREEMFIQEIDTKILSDAEKAYSIRTDLKKKMYFGKLYK